MNLPPLNCNGCTTCCEGDTITLVEGDNPALYKTKLVNGRRVLAKGKDGNCIYLGKRGCQRHSQPRPLMCQALDCRLYALQVENYPPALKADRMASEQNRRVVLEGRKRLGAQAE